ncbi:MAG: hypothetical protein ACI8TX_003664 [Hyphomicrobiaceae bacterium]
MRLKLGNTDRLEAYPTNTDRLEAYPTEVALTI